MGFLDFFFGNNSNDALAEIVNNGAFLVDVRNPDEFAGGSAKGAINIPLDQIPNHISKFKNKDNIVVFCRSGNRSSMAKSILEKNGIANVTNGGTWQHVAGLIS
jgi:rhodanese-related sulfurtransferase